MASTIRKAPQVSEDRPLSPIGVPQAGTAWHWFDFTCPFCYVARSRNEILFRYGLSVIHLPLQAHPGIPAAGIAMGPRSGEMYERLEREAHNAGVPLCWPSRLPNSHYALTVAEWVRRNHSRGFDLLHDQLFSSHFALGEDIGDAALVDRYAALVGADVISMRRSVADGRAYAAVEESESAARQHRFVGTPAWLVESHRIEGLQQKSVFEQVGRDLERRPSQ